MYVVLGRSLLLLSQEFLRDLGCHIDLGRGHLFFEKLGVRAVVTSEQSPHLLLPLTSFGPQGHKFPAEIQPRISSDECAIYRAACDSSRQNKIHSWTRLLKGIALSSSCHVITFPGMYTCGDKGLCARVEWRKAQHNTQHKSSVPHCHFPASLIFFPAFRLHPPPL